MKTSVSPRIRSRGGGQSSPQGVAHGRAWPREGPPAGCGAGQDAPPSHRSLREGPRRSNADAQTPSGAPPRPPTAPWFQTTCRLATTAARDWLRRPPATRRSAKYDHRLHEENIFKGSGEHTAARKEKPQPAFQRAAAISRIPFIHMSVQHPCQHQHRLLPGHQDTARSSRAATKPAIPSFKRIGRSSKQP